jgi:hypothetical protein
MVLDPAMLLPGLLLSPITPPVIPPPAIML